MTLKICPNCKTIYYGEDFYCIKCRYRLIHYTEEEYKKDQFEKKQSRTTQQLKNTPECPTCHSTDVKRISDARKVAGALMFGIFSKTAKSQFQCNNCGYKW